MQHHSLRRTNEKAVLRTIGSTPGVSNAEISRICNLAPQTVSAILLGLEKSGLVERGAVLRGRRGQPATPYFLRAASGYAIGVEIGWKHLSAVLIDMHARVLEERHIHYAYPDADLVVQQICDWTEAFRQSIATQPENLLDLGVAMPGTFDAGLVRLGAPEAIKARWGALDLKGILATRTGLTVSLINDGSAACWAEYNALDLPRPDKAVGLLCSSYLGAGIVENGSVWGDMASNAANLGAMLVPTPSGVACSAHSIGSVVNLRNSLAALGKAQPHDPQLWDWQAIAPEIQTWLSATAFALAHVVFNTTMVVEPKTAIVSTIFGDAITEQLRQRVDDELAKLPSEFHQPPKIVAGCLGPLAPAMGAAELALLHRYF